jgi:hypothetical protein
MPSVYLQPSEYALFNLDESTSASTVLESSKMIDSYCNRPEGFVNDGLVMEAHGVPLVDVTIVPARRRVVLTRRPVTDILEVLYATGPVPFDWQPVPEHWEFDADQGQLWLTPSTPTPARLKVKYLSGWRRENLPCELKYATAITAKSRAQHDADDLPSNVKKAAAGNSSLEFFSNSSKSGLFIDPEVRQLLAPYVRVI